MSRRLETLARTGKARLRYRWTQPRWIPPMLATLADAAPRGGHWVYEPKLDGVRVLVYASDGNIQLFSRNRKSLDGAYPELVDALSFAVRGDAVLDGEVVAVDPKTGQSSFSRLQRRMQLRDEARARGSGVPVELYLFDCMFYEGIDLTNLPLVGTGRRCCATSCGTTTPIRFTPFRTTGSAAMFRDACAKGAEGIIAKRAESPYVSVRSTDWLKVKCVHQQELVVGGYTAPKGSRENLGALLVGYYDHGALRYAGKVGTGYDRAALEMLLHGPARHAAVRPGLPGTLSIGARRWGHVARLRCH